MVVRGVRVVQRRTVVAGRRHHVAAPAGTSPAAYSAIGDQMDHERDPLTNETIVHDTDTTYVGRDTDLHDAGTAPENEEGGKEALGAGAGALGGAAVGMAV